MGFASTPVRGGTPCLWVAMAAIAMWSAPASASKPLRQGTLSVGILASYDLLRLQDLNTQIDIYNQETGTRLNDLTDGVGVLGEVRYAFWRKVSLGVELGYFSGASDDPVYGERIEVSGVPFSVTVGWLVYEENDLSFRVLSGLGYLFDGTFRQVGGREASESDFLFQIGGELEWRPVTMVGLSLQGLARQANVQQPAGFATDLDFSGGTIRAGIRGHWGGHDE